jgi:predicted DNA-binding ribbon-helix-helix protein
VTGLRRRDVETPDDDGMPKRFNFLCLINHFLMISWFNSSQKSEVAMTISRLINRNVVAKHGRTSIRLEPELWDMLEEICKREAENVNTLVRHIEASGHAGGRTSAVRVFIANYFHIAATEAGHMSVGHGSLMRRIPQLARSAA